MKGPFYHSSARLSFSRMCCFLTTLCSFRHEPKNNTFYLAVFPHKRAEPFFCVYFMI